MKTSGVTIVVGSGESSVNAIREASSLHENWIFARERGVGGERVAAIATGEESAAGEEWCVVLERGAVVDSDLDADPAVATWEHVPDDSPALAKWRAV
jgi:hypothetical protein